MSTPGAAAACDGASPFEASSPAGEPVGGIRGPGQARRAAVLGHPVGHSLSPVLHRAAYAELGLSGWRYDAIDVDEAGLPGFLAGLDATWAGLSLTMPLKRAVLPLLVDRSPLAAQVGAVNTVTFTPAGPVGDNTDVPGIVRALREAGVSTVRRCAILGGGATAASALAAVQLLGCSTPVVHVRSAGRCQDLLAAAERLGARPRLAGLGAEDLSAGRSGHGHDAGLPPELLVSTLPAGAADDLAPALLAGPAGPIAAPRPGGLPVLLDVVYAPWPPPLARAWAAAGGAVVGGFEMLLHQAAGQVELMTGHRAPVEAMRAAGLAELSRRALVAGGAG